MPLAAVACTAVGGELVEEVQVTAIGTVLVPEPDIAETKIVPLKPGGATTTVEAAPLVVEPVELLPRLELNVTNEPSTTGAPLLVTIANTVSLAPQGMVPAARDSARKLAGTGVEVAVGAAVAVAVAVAGVLVGVAAA